MLDVLDALLTLVEPGGTVDASTSLRTSTSGTVVDHVGARPFGVDLDPDRLYGWLVQDRHAEVFEAGDPPSYREEFGFTLMYVAETDEQARSRRSRAVSEVLDARAHSYLGLVAANPVRDGLWTDLWGELDPSAVLGFSVRGFALRMNGWRYRQPS